MTFRLRPNARMCCGHASELATSERSSTGAVWNRPSDASFRARRACDRMSPVVQASCRGAMHHGCFSLRPSPRCGEDSLLRRAVETLDAVSVMLTRPRLLRDDSGSRPAFSLHYQVHPPQRPKSNDSGCPVSLPRHTRRAPRALRAGLCGVANFAVAEADTATPGLGRPRVAVRLLRPVAF
jgi:hypothetical protein